MRHVRTVLILLLLVTAAQSLHSQKHIIVALELDPRPPAEIFMWTSGRARAILSVLSSGIGRPIYVDVTITITNVQSGTIVGTVSSKVEIDTGMNHLTWADLSSPGSLSEMNYDPTAETYVTRTNRIPAGQYRYCVTVTNESLGIVSKVCETITIEDIRPPRLRFPRDGKRIDRNERPRFEWTPVAGAGTGARYRFLLMKVHRDQRQTPVNAFRGNVPICDVTVPVNSTWWPPALPLLDTGLYVWSVQAVNESGNPLGGPDSWADPFVLTIESSTATGGDVASLPFPPPVPLPTASSSSSADAIGGTDSQSGLASNLWLQNDALDKTFDGDIGVAPFLFVNTDRQAEREFDGPEVIRDTTILLDPALLRVGSPVAAEFFRDTIKIAFNRVRRMRSGVAWSGKVVGEDESHVIFVARGEGDTAIGNIVRDNRLYLVRYAGNGVHTLMEIDQSRFSAEVPPRRTEWELCGGDFPKTDPPDRVDVMVLYTPDARKAAGGSSLADLDIMLAVAETNLTYEYSGVGHRLELVHTAEVRYQEARDPEADLDWLKGNADVAALRDRHAADIVMMFVENTGGDVVGLADVMPYPDHCAESSAFGIVKRTAATVKYTFGHEIGHIMGCVHECGNETAGSSFVPYGRGYRNPKERWRTIMAGPRADDAGTLPLYSNPSLAYMGHPVGAMEGECTACEACVLEMTAPVVANYRRHLPVADNVLMKDTWSDAGVEPGLIDSAGYPWSAPGIEVLRDTALSFDPLRRVPRNGRPRWISVTLQNGGSDTATGELELYGRQASLTAEWDSSWRRIASIPRTIPPAATVNVLSEWKDVPGDGHYSLVARWVSRSDTMHAPERGDLLANVLNNNNVVWKNEFVMPVYPTTGSDTPEKFNRPASTAQATFRAIPGSIIEIVCERSTLSGKSLVGQNIGDLLIRFDEKSAALIATDGDVSGAARTGNATYRVTSEEKAIFRLAGGDGASGTIAISFVPGPASSRAVYPVHVLQKSAEGEIVGGASYRYFYPLDPAHNWSSYAIGRDTASADLPDKSAGDVAQSSGPRGGAISFFSDVYEYSAGYPVRRAAPRIERVVLNPSLALGGRYAIEPMVAFSTRQSDAVIPAPKNFSPLDMLLSPASSVGIAPRYGILGLDIGSQTPDVSPLVGSNVQLFGLGATVSPGNFRFALSGGLSQSAVEVMPDTVPGSYARVMIVGRMGWEHNGSKAGLNVLYALDRRNSIEVRDDSTLFYTFGDSVVGENSSLVTIDRNPSQCIGSIVTAGGRHYRVEPGPVLIDTSTDSTLHLIDSARIPNGASLPSPVENTVVSLEGAWRMNDAISIAAEAAGSLFTADTRVGDLSEPDLLSNEIVSAVGDVFPLRLSTRLDGALRASISINRENREPWSLQIGALYVGPGYASLGTPYMRSDRLEITARPEVELLGGRVLIRGDVRWRRDDPAGNDPEREEETDASVDLFWQASDPLTVGVVYDGTILNVRSEDDAGDVRSVRHGIRVAPGYRIDPDGIHFLHAVGAVVRERIRDGIPITDEPATRSELLLMGSYQLSLPESLHADANVSLMRSSWSDRTRTELTDELSTTLTGSVGLQYPLHHGRLVPRLQTSYARFGFSDGRSEALVVVGGRIGWRAHPAVDIRMRLDVSMYTPEPDGDRNALHGGLDVRWKL